jgi:serine/threonine protein kinase
MAEPDYKESRSGNLIIKNDNSVIKVIFFSKKTQGGVDLPDDATHPSHVEIYFTKRISDYISCNPNIVNTGKIRIVDGDDEIARGMEEFGLSKTVINKVDSILKGAVYNKIGLIECERGDMDLQEYILENKTDDDIDQILRECMFQIFYQIHMLRNNIQNFVHGDLKPNNILMIRDSRYDESEEKYACYELNGRNYYIKIRRLIPKIWDYEFSKSAGISNRLYDITYQTLHYGEEMIDIYRFMVHAIYDFSNQSQPSPDESGAAGAADAGYTEADIGYEGTDGGYTEGDGELSSSTSVPDIPKKSYVDGIRILSDLTQSIKPANVGFYRGGNVINITYLQFLQNVHMAQFRDKKEGIEPCFTIRCKNRCAIFDFDCTLTSVHTAYAEMGILETAIDENKEYQSIIQKMKLGRDTSDEIVKIINIFFGGIERLEMLRNMIETLIENGFDIYISSRGNCEVIEKMLTITDLRKYILEINANGIGCVNQKKDVYIKNLMARGYDTLIYADDDHGEYHILIESLTGKNMESERAVIRQNPMMYRKESESGLIKTTHGDKTLIFIPTLKLFTSDRQDPEARGLEGHQVDLIITLSKPVSSTSSSSSNNSSNSSSNNADNNQSGGYYHKYIKYKLKYVQLRAVIAQMDRY